MPRSALTGRPRTLVLDIVRDDDGRAVQLRGELSSGWSDSDVAAALVAAEESQSQCDGCGHPLTVSTDPDTEDRWEATAVRCHSCREARRVSDEWAKTPGADTRGLRVRTRLDDSGGV